MRLAWVTRVLSGLGVITREIVKLPAYSADAERLYRQMRHPAGSPQPSVAPEPHARAVEQLRPSSDAVTVSGAFPST